jgi:hypothetical protein
MSGRLTMPILSRCVRFTGLRRRRSGDPLQRCFPGLALGPPQAADGPGIALESPQSPSENAWNARDHSESTVRRLMKQLEERLAGALGD